MYGKKQRIAAISALLVQNPGKVFPYKYFVERFGIAKSGISEDIGLISRTLGELGAGKVQTLRGAQGGVRFIPGLTGGEKKVFIESMTRSLSDTSRILPGGYLYIVDLFSTPYYVDRMAQLLAEWFYESRADFVVTVETKGIPLAMSVARLLGLPLAIARRQGTVTDGPIFSVNYLTGSSRRLQTMSMPRRMLSEGTKALIIDDFIGGGGTVGAIRDMLSEFNISVAGIGAAIVKKYPQKKKISAYKTIFTLEELSETRIEIVSNIEE